MWGIGAPMASQKRQNQLIIISERPQDSMHNYMYACVFVSM